MSTHTVHVGEVERSGRVEEGEVRGIDGRKGLERKGWEEMERGGGALFNSWKHKHVPR